MKLGRSLRLPPWLEPSRDQIEHGLPTLKVPGPGEEVIIPRPPDKAAT
jgi:glyoxalase family protein